MFICLCKGITDTQIKASVLAGARSLSDVRKDLGVATQCCKCLPEARAVIQQTLEQHHEQPMPNSAAPIFYSV